MKVECIDGERFTTRKIMRQTVFDYIETEYNRNRPHRTQGYLSPVDFETQLLAS